MSKRPDKFKRWMIASFFLIPLVLFGSIGVYYAYFPVKMHILIHLLRYDRTRMWAQGEIVEAGDRAIPYLVDGFASRNDRVRMDAFCLLVCPPPLRSFSFAFVPDSRLNLAKALSCAVRGLRSRNANKRCLSALLLGEFAYRGVKDERASPRLIELLSDPEAEVRAAAAQALGNCDAKEAKPELLRLLSDPHPRARADAARALGHLGAKEAAPNLIKLLRDPDAGVRSGVAGALGRLDAREAAPQLLKLLSDPEHWVRTAAIYALGEIAWDEAVGPLLTVLKEKPVPGVSPLDWGLFQSGVIQALEKITGQSFGDVDSASDAQRQAIVQKWLDWWEENKEKYQEQTSQSAKE